MNRLRERPGHVRLMGEYGVLYPLWGPWGHIPEDPDHVMNMFSVDQQILQRLEAWNRRWEAASTDADDDWLKAEGESLLMVLRDASPDVAFELVL